MLEKLGGRAVTGRVAFLISGLIDLGFLVGYLMRMWRQRRRSSSRAEVACLAAGLAFVGVSALGGVGAPVARASTTEQSILMDDYAFIYSSPAEVVQNLEQIKALGVTTVKVSMVWSLVAPDPNSTTEPSFDATNPAAYPAGSWTRYDDLVQEADALGLRVYFQLTGPAPLWATSDDSQVTGQEKDWSHDINPTMFGQFVQAVGARYSGDYPIAGDGDTPTYSTEESSASSSSALASSSSALASSSSASSSSASSSSASSSASSGSAAMIGNAVQSILGNPLSTTADSSSTIPAVNEWGIWNEPNEAQWLSPQTEPINGTTIHVAPIIERSMINDAYDSLILTGHANDTILIGETSSLGDTHTIPFLQDLYCLNANDKPLTGTAATDLLCPTSGNRHLFVEDNPGLFGASGYADHAYDFAQAPNAQIKGEPWAMDLANISALGAALDKIDSAYGEPTGLPIYNTEWGYKSDPPNPLVSTNLTEQEDWLDQGYYMSYLMPRLKSMAQELLYDQPPTAGDLPGDLGYWAEFDTGLEFEDGQQKPSYAAYRLPIWVPDPKASHHMRLWAEIRPAVVGDNDTAELQYRSPGSASWINLTTLTTSDADGFIYTYVSLPNPGTIRLAWADRTADAIYYSRTVPIT